MINDAQKQFIQDKFSLNFDYSHMTDDEYFKLNDTVADYLLTKGLGPDYEPTPDGRMCEEILDAIADL